MTESKAGVMQGKETFASYGSNWPLNRRWVTKECRHCGKTFDTDAPWRVNCSFNCTRDRMEALQRARRAKKKEEVGAQVECIVCRAQKGSVAFYKNKYKSKGICYGCVEDMERMEFDHKKVYRMAYAMTALKRYIKA